MNQRPSDRDSRTPRFCSLADTTIVYA